MFEEIYLMQSLENRDHTTEMSLKDDVTISMGQVDMVALGGNNSTTSPQGNMIRINEDERNFTMMAQTG